MTDKPYTPVTYHLGKLIWETIHNDVYETDLSVSGAYNLVAKIMASEWYAADIAAAEQRGKEQAWDEGYQDGYNDGLSDGHNLDNMRDPNENPYRADQEGDDE